MFKIHIMHFMYLLLCVDMRDVTMTTYASCMLGRKLSENRAHLSQFSQTNTTDNIIVYI